MSDELGSMTKYLQGMLKDWQVSTNAITSNDFTSDKQKRFAEGLLSGMGNFLNKKSVHRQPFRLRWSQKGHGKFHKKASKFHLIQKGHTLENSRKWKERSFTKFVLFKKQW